MRQMCPYCGKLVDLPDDAAGREVPCPLCAKSFAVPSSYTPSVAEEKPAPPPGLVPPAAATPEATLAGALNDDESAMTFDGRLAGWLAPISLTLTLVSALFFSWCVSYPGGYRVFSQSPIQALFASFDQNQISSMQEMQKSIIAVISWNWLMLPFLLALIVVTVLAWLDRFYPKPTILSLPAPIFWMVKFHTMRHTILIALTSFCLVLCLVQIVRGFGLESAIRTIATQAHAGDREKADNAMKSQVVDIAVGQEIGKWCLGGTLARNLAVIFLIVALESLIVRWWLEYRGPLPPPRLVLQY